MGTHLWSLKSNLQTVDQFFFLFKMAEVKQQQFEEQEMPQESQDWAVDDFQEPEIIDDPKIFGIWSFADVQCGDITLADHINFKGKYAKYLPHNSERYNKIRFKKIQCQIVERLVNSCPREDSTRIGRAGSVRRQACDVSPMRRVNQAIWLITTGAKNAAFRNIKTIAECLADELMNAAKGSSNSFA